MLSNWDVWDAVEFRTDETPQGSIVLTAISCESIRIFLSISVNVIPSAWAPSTTFGKPYIPIKDMGGSDGGAPSTPSGVAPSVDTCKSTDVASLGPCVVQNERPPPLPAIGPDLKGWAPPLGRDLHPVLYKDASGAKPSGGDSPSLLPS